MVAGAILDRETAHVEYRIHKSTRVAFSLLVHDQPPPAPYASYTIACSTILHPFGARALLTSIVGTLIAVPPPLSGDRN